MWFLGGGMRIGILFTIVYFTFSGCASTGSSPAAKPAYRPRSAPEITITQSGCDSDLVDEFFSPALQSDVGAEGLVVRVYVAMNCAYSAKNPGYQVKGKELEIAYEADTRSGWATACECSSWLTITLRRVTEAPQKIRVYQNGNLAIESAERNE
jgi:hypothetical protein